MDAGTGAVGATVRHRIENGRFQRGILLEDHALELAERRRRLDPELVGEQVSRILVRGQRLRLPSRSVKREHLLPPETLA